MVAEIAGGFIGMSNIMNDRYYSFPEVGNQPQRCEFWV